MRPKGPAYLRVRYILGILRVSRPSDTLELGYILGISRVYLRLLKASLGLKPPYPRTQALDSGLQDPRVP